MTLSPDEILVVKLDSQGEEVWRYPGKVLTKSDHSLLIEARFNHSDVEIQGITLRERIGFWNGTTMTAGITSSKPETGMTTISRAGIVTSPGLPVSRGTKLSIWIWLWTCWLSRTGGFSFWMKMNSKRWTLTGDKETCPGRIGCPDCNCKNERFC